MPQLGVTLRHGSHSSGTDHRDHASGMANTRLPIEVAVRTRRYVPRQGCYAHTAVALISKS